MPAILLMFIFPLLFLAVVCAYGPLEDRVKDRRRVRRREVERAVSAYRPIRIAELTPRGWAEVVAIGGTW